MRRVTVPFGGLVAANVAAWAWALIAFRGVFWDAVGSLNENFGLLGYLIIAVFVLSWVASVAVCRARGYGRIEAET